jgi:FlaA1/EpsC-like NDP-sugar epimerase
MLDMGSPVKISELAKNLITLSGLQTGDDIEIVYTGLRPGEKIEEELMSVREDLMPTRFEKIRKLKNDLNEPDKMQKFTASLSLHIERANIKSLYDDAKSLVPEMTGPSFEEMTARLFG